LFDILILLNLTKLETSNNPISNKQSVTVMFSISVVYALDCCLY